MSDRAQRLIFVLGGARSGKSAYAEQWAQQHAERVLFVATAQAFDDDMQARIEHHRNDRPPEWDTLEEPLHPAAKIAAQMANYDVILVDCLTLLASNILLTLPDDATQEDANQAILTEIQELLDVVQQSGATWLIISNEVGLGVVPPTRLGRLFRDALGRANQRVALAADDVVLMVAGLPWRLKPQG